MVDQLGKGTTNASGLANDVSLDLQEIMELTNTPISLDKVIPGFKLTPVRHTSKGGKSKKLGDRRASKTSTPPFNGDVDQLNQP